MKSVVKLSLCLFFSFSSLYATNGDNLIATGAKSRGMGGIGIAKTFGAESALSNPALLSTVKHMEATGSLTLFTPNVTYASDTLSKAQNPSDTSFTSSDSNDDTNVIPEVAFAQRINDIVVYGVAVTGTASMGVDYSEENPSNTLAMKTDLQLLKIAVPFAIVVDDFSFGISPIVQFGTLEMSHVVFDGGGNLALLDKGPSSDTGYGFEFGTVYDFKNVGVEGLYAGLIYKSKIKMQYNNTISASVNAFDAIKSTGISSGDNLDQPAEIGAGVNYSFDEHSFAFDYKHIAWGDAAGFKDFGWEDQDVLALGYEYKTPMWTLRAGYNYASSPIKEQDGNTYGGAIKNSFNLAGFPGITEKHYTFGGSYFANEEVELDLAVVLAGETSESFNTSGATQTFYSALNSGATTNATSQADVMHSQFSITMGATYKF